MANHQGFIFIAPNGHYLTRNTVNTHGPNAKTVMGLTQYIDAATLFPTEILQCMHGDWSSVRDGIRDMCNVSDVAPIAQYLLALHAKSFQRIEIQTNESTDET